MIYERKTFVKSPGPSGCGLHRRSVPCPARQKTQLVETGAIAACLCVALLAGVLFKIPGSDVTIAPGFLVVTAYAASSDEEITMQEGIELPTDYKWSLAMSSRPGLPLKLSATEYDDLSFEVSVDGGTLLFGRVTK